MACYCSSYSNNDNFKWKLIIAGNGYYYLENAFSGDKIHMENQTGSLECTPIASDSPSSIWEKRTVNGTHNKFLNTSTSNQYMNIENNLGYAEHSSINASWESAQWELKEVPNILDLNKTTFKNVLLFPNPTNDLVTIQSFNHISNLTVYDIIGKRLNVDIVTTSSSKLQFSVKNLNSGIYYIKIKNNLGTITKKLIVKH